MATHSNIQEKHNRTLRIQETWAQVQFHRSISLVLPFVLAQAGLSKLQNWGVVWTVSQDYGRFCFCLWTRSNNHSHGKYCFKHQRLFFYLIVYGQVSSDLNTATSESLSFQIWVILNLLIPQILTKDLLCKAPSHTPQRQGWIRVSLYGQAEMLCDSSLPRPVWDKRALRVHSIWER